MPRALTTRTIETLKPGPVRKEIPDGYLPNLYLILQPSGVRSFAVRYRIGGGGRGRRSVKYTLGSYPAIDLKSARELGAQAPSPTTDNCLPHMYCPVGAIVY
jgi:hypothetical protein